MTATSAAAATMNATTEMWSTTAEQWGLPFSEATAIAVTCILAPMAVFGIFANLTTIIVIVKSKNLRSVFSLFIVSLSVSDCLSALISPIFIYRRTWGFNVWQIPEFFCSFSWCIHMWTNYVTSIHIVCFAALRWCAIARPVKFRKIKSRHGNISIVAIWLITFFAGGLPLALLFGVEPERRSGSQITSQFPACGVYRNKINIFRMYHNIAYPIFFYLPIVLVTIISVLVYLAFRERQTKKREYLNGNTCAKTVSSGHQTSGESKQEVQTTVQKNKKQSQKESWAILQLALIVGSFLLGYVPFTIYQLLSYSSKPNTFAQKISDWNFGISEYILLRFSECLNPIFYNLASKTMRQETIHFLKSVFRCSRLRR